MISYATIDAVRDLSIVDVVGKYVDLKKSGANYRALSPFSDEKSPSFFVVPAKQIFKCFSSGKGGSGIRFVMEKEGFDYPEAIKALCSMFNIDLQYETNGAAPEHYEEIELFYKINQATAALYARELLNVDANHPAFHELIDKRLFTADTLLQWQIGYAPGEIGGFYTPSKWNYLTTVMIAKGYYKQGIELGLVKTKDDVNYDVFRGRIVFPIIDHNDRYVGFGGRTLVNDKFNPKYINSPDSKIYNKSKVLYGLHYASHAIRKRGYVNLMEGYTDVISFHQAGEINSVGTCGTALTADQAKLLRKYTNKAVLIYDPDEAGQNAGARCVDLLLGFGFQCSMVPMPSLLQQKRQAGREVVLISERNKELLRYQRCKTDPEAEILMENVESIGKVDPDELVRMF